jgi:hypothetical protein
MTDPVFVSTAHTLTPDGERLKTFLESQFVEADRRGDLMILNNLSGPVHMYYTMVYKLHSLTPERWLEDYQRTYAQSAWRIMRYFEEKAEAEAAASRQATALSEGLDELRAKLESALAEIEALKAEREAKPAEPEAAAEEPAEPEAVAEPEAAAEPEAEAEVAAPLESVRPKGGAAAR